MVNLYDAFDAFEPFRRQQEMINKMINPPAMQALRDHQNLIKQVTNFNSFGHLDSEFSKVRLNKWYDKIPTMGVFNNYNTGMLPISLIRKVAFDFGSLVLNSYPDS